MSHAEQLERETEHTREQIANTLDELRARMTPGYVLDQLADRVGAGAAATFARNLRDQAVNNPLPIALIGTGLTWLMLGPRRASALGATSTAGGQDMASMVRQGDVEEAVEGWGATTAGAAQSAGQSAAEAGENIRDFASSTADRARQGAAEAGNNVRDFAASAADRARQGAARAADAVSETSEAARQAAGQAGDAVRAGAGAMAATMQRTASATKAAGQRTLQSGGALVDFCRDQPLLLAGIGIAMGAMIGALLPATDTENRLMGESSDRAKERAQDLAAREYEAAKDSVSRGAAQAAERAADVAEEQMGKNEGREPAAPWKDDAKEGTETGAHEPTLAPSGPDETRGQPWPAENAPL